MEPLRMKREQVVEPINGQCPPDRVLHRVRLDDGSCVDACLLPPKPVTALENSDDGPLLTDQVDLLEVDFISLSPWCVRRVSDADRNFLCKAMRNSEAR